MNKYVLTKDLFDCKNMYLKPLFDKSEYPWQILPLIKEYIKTIIEGKVGEFTEISSNVWVGKDVKISDTARIDGPTILGSKTEVRPGAFLRGSIITGENCVIGNSTELKNCILLDNVQVPHYNYVGDSVLGNFAHMGAGSICSNLKSDGKTVIVHGDKEYNTNLRKVGGILGDHADVGCGCVINPGTVIGKCSSVYPLTSLRGVIPCDCIVKSMENIVPRRT